MRPTAGYSQLPVFQAQAFPGAAPQPQNLNGTFRSLPMAAAVPRPGAPATMPSVTMPPAAHTVSRSGSMVAAPAALQQYGVPGRPQMSSWVAAQPVPGSMAVRQPSQIAPMPSQVAPMPSHVALKPSQAAPMPSLYAPMPSQVAPGSSLVAPFPSQVAPVPSQVAPIPSQVVLAPSQVAPVPSQVAPAPSSEEAFDFLVGDLVKLRGQSGNPAYADKVYKVEDVQDNGNVTISHKLDGGAVSRMTFNKSYLDLVQAVEDVPPEAEGDLQDNGVVAQEQQEDTGFRPGDKVQISGLEACARHNGKLCMVDAVDQATKAVRVMFLDSNNMLELAPDYLQLVEAVQDNEQPLKLPDAAFEQAVDGSPEVGTMVQILAPPHHAGKIARVETPNNGSGTLKIRLEDPMDSVATLVVSPAHVANLDGSPVAGTSEAVAASQAQADALRDAATLAPSSANAAAAAAASVALAPGAKICVKASMAHHSGKTGIVETVNDGTGNAVIQLKDLRGGVMRLNINPAHLELI